jgi:peptidoglycan/LPS O-acetylase OafA/YrhL
LSLFFDLPPLLHLPGNEVGLGNALANGAACLAFAYSFPGLAARWLRGSDLSYGMYLFHLPITNVFVVTGVVGIPGAGGVFVATVVSAFLSWHLVEKRALAFKPRLQQFFSGERVLKGKVAT